VEYIYLLNCLGLADWLDSCSEFALENIVKKDSRKQKNPTNEFNFLFLNEIS
jgi:hypothetical protein